MGSDGAGQHSSFWRLQRFGVYTLGQHAMMFQSDSKLAESLFGFHKCASCSAFGPHHQLHYPDVFLIVRHRTIIPFVMISLSVCPKLYPVVRKQETCIDVDE